MDTRLSKITLFIFIFASFASNVSAQIIYQDLHLVPKYAKTHGLVMGLTFVVILPLGALFIRAFSFKGSLWLHIACQIIGTALMITGLATGIKVAKILDRLHNNAHTILGTIVVALLLIQPFIGFIHHRRFMATQKQNLWTQIHVWYGRVLILLGMINGGLGLMLAANTTAGKIVYGILAGVVGVTYCAAVVFSIAKKDKVEKRTSDIAMEESSK